VGAQAEFQVLIPGLQTAPDALDLWQVIPAEVSPAIQAKTGLVWRANLPGDLDGAANLVQLQDYQLQNTHLALPAAQKSLELELQHLPSQEAARQVSFDLQQGATSGTPAILRRALLYQVDAVDYASFLDRSEIERVANEAIQFALQVQHVVAQFALVETSFGGIKAGVTRVAWGGDVDTWFTPDLSAEHISLHRKVLAQSLATRQGWMRFLVIFTSGALRVAASLAATPFSLLTIWTTWSYLQQVLKEFRQLRPESS
jgi:hypothetical protein